MKIEDVKRIVLPVLRSRGVKRAGLFGSVVRGESRRDSDVDVLVEVDDGDSLLDLAGLKNELEDTLGRSVDLVEYGTIKPMLRRRILQEQVTIL